MFLRGFREAEPDAAEFRPLTEGGYESNMVVFDSKHFPTTQAKD